MLTEEQEKALQVESEINEAADTGTEVARDVVATETVEVITDTVEDNPDTVEDESEVLTEEVSTEEVITEDSTDSGVIVEPEAPPLPGGSSTD